MSTQPGTSGQTPLYEDLPCGHLLLGADSLIVRANRLFAQWLGCPPQHIEQRLRLTELLTPGSRVFYSSHVVPLLALQGFANEVSLELTTAGGQALPVLLNAQHLEGAGSQDALISVTAFNASATRRYEQMLVATQERAERALDELREQREQLRVTLESMADAVVTVDANGQVKLLNPAAAALLRVDAREVVERPFAEVVRLLWADDQQPRPCPVVQCLFLPEAQQETRASLLRAHDGTLCPISDTVAPIHDARGRCTGAIWVCRDVSEQHRLAEHAAHALRHDMLTGLLNRQEFEQALARCAAAQGWPGYLLCYLDIDQFKLINDTLGHAAGDLLLRELAQLLRDGLRKDDLLARLGGDEFGMLLKGCSAGEAVQRAQALRKRIQDHHFHWEGGTHRVTASMGVAQLPGPGEPASMALIHADIACHAAKEAGRNRVQFFTSADTLVQARHGEMHWVPRLQQALAQDRFELLYQPIVATAPGASRVKYGEILLRLRDDDGQLVSPALFIPAAERYQLMSALDRMVLRKTLDWMQRTPSVHCSINVSGQSLGDLAFLDEAVTNIKRSRVDARRLCFEITETAAIGNLEAAQAVIAQLRALGARFALDDFGAGMSSFAYLHLLKADVLKIDGGFVKDLHRDPRHRAIVESIHHVAAAFDMRTVAEWVENEAILDELRAIGIDYAQGYFTGRPVPLKSWNAESPWQPTQAAPAGAAVS
ncbi:putative bifunctional diguanylate cyclase/phosphodiesterase [Azohydromonas lata]|uniref:EAL domain-containing protein n=1 Tax=Azohydromonas lata TaxID=45677 RepID=A0ABU5IP65_9BURK|nr:EAL domain-containing protein [Azohydromonas lata]MDZ5460666.1 EAL domain-containing protein [Azohydromonas lata]